MTNPDPSSTDTEMNGQSLDIAEQRRKELEQLFPGIFTENRNDQGELKVTMDLERLKAELGEFTDIYDSRRERYGMDWPGKRDCLRLIQQPSTATLKPCREESVDFDTTENLFIEGDNLEVLKLLQKSYYGKVKMIYIDPPYNTGKEFIYPDNFSESLDTYLQYAGLKDSEGRTFSTNTANEGRFHTKWLNMMYPRLYLARNLLREDGVIFISIDDNEVENLRRMCDEIFGEENFLAQFIWNTEGNTDNSYKVKVNHEYIVAYYRNSQFSDDAIGYVIDPNTPEDSNLRKGYADNNINKNNPENPPTIVTLPMGFPCSEDQLFYSAKGIDQEFIDTALEEKYISDELKEKYGLESKSGLPVKLDNMIVKNGVLAEPCRIFVGMANKNKLLEYINNGCNDVSEDGQPIRFYINSNAAVRYRKAVSSARNILSVLRRMGTTERSKTYLKNLGVYYSYPKPVDLISYLLEIGNAGDGIVLDFFAGSATTAEAVFRSNAQGKGTKFIVVQLPEQIDPDNREQKAALKFCTDRNLQPRVSELSKERLRRCVSGIRKDEGNQLELNSVQSIDFGFKVLRLNQSNFKLWRAPAKDISDEELLQQMELNVDHIDPNAGQEDLLYELLIKAGVMPTETVEQIELAGHTLFSVADGSLLVHLEDDIDQALLDAVLAKEPGQFICLDKAFHGNDQLKTNAVKTFEAFNQGKEKIDQIDFKTV